MSFEIKGSSPRSSIRRNLDTVLGETRRGWKRLSQTLISTFFVAEMLLDYVFFLPKREGGGKIKGKLDAATAS